jgi:hypothetical protein
MKSTSRLAVWLVFIGLVCLTLVSCKLGSFVLQQVTPTAPPTNTPLPTPVPPTETPTLPPPPTNTPLPPPTEAPTAIPLPTDTPLPTPVPPTDTPSLSLVTVVNNLGQTINISITGPAQKTFSVRAHSEYTFETPPGQYTYRFEAQNFYPDTGYITFEPGPFTWTFGKARD